MRVAGFSIRQKLDKKVSEISIVGNDSLTLALAEGLALSNYQFLKYFKDADDREFQLEKIFILGNIPQSEIDVMNNVIKSVFWARDMVNEPSSYLSAKQLSKEIQEIGDEAGFSVEVLEKAEIQKLFFAKVCHITYPLKIQG